MRSIDVLQVIRQANSGRNPKALADKFSTMKGSNAFAFLRATAELYDGRLEAKDLPESPEIWICGDLHVENFGAVAGSKGKSLFQVNDFDQCALAPVAADLVRLLTSIRVAASTLELQGRDWAGPALDTYLDTLKSGDVSPWDPSDADGLVAEFLKKRSKRTAADLLDKETPDRKRLTGNKTWPIAVSGPTQANFERALADLGKQTFAGLKPKAFGFLDAGFRASGLGSLGVEHYWILTTGVGDPVLVDLKQAKPSAAGLIWPQSLEARGARIVAVQQASQTDAPPRAAIDMAGVDYFAGLVRSIDEKFDLEKANEKAPKPKAFAQAFADMAEVAARAHLRSSALNRKSASLVHWADSVNRKSLLELAKTFAEQNAADQKTFAKSGA